MSEDNGTLRFRCRCGGVYEMHNEDGVVVWKCDKCGGYAT